MPSFFSRTTFVRRPCCLRSSCSRLTEVSLSHLRVARHDRRWQISGSVCCVTFKLHWYLPAMAKPNRILEGLASISDHSAGYVVWFHRSHRTHEVSTEPLRCLKWPQTVDSGTDNAASTTSRHRSPPAIPPSLAVIGDDSGGGTGEDSACLTFSPLGYISVRAPFPPDGGSCGDGGIEQSRFGSQVRRLTLYRIRRRS